MNLHPKVRPLWQRAIALPVLTMLMVYKATRLPTFFMPRDIRNIIKHWDFRVFWVLISSGLTRAYIDQPCEFKVPANCEPKIVVEPKWRLTEKQLRKFYEDGFIGPLDAFAPEEMADFRKEMLDAEKSVSQTYGFVTPRDRHFENPRLWGYMKHPAITERLAQILGPDLNVWRTQMFHKPPKAPAIQFHQASTFMVEDYQVPALHPANRDEIFQLTVWIAVDDATYENGCLDFVRGSHSRVNTIKFGGEEGFYNAAYSLEYDRDPSRVVRVPCKSGQFIIFMERCIHGSLANTTDRHRLAFNLRAIPTNVAVYPGVKKYRSVYNGGKYLLDQWGVVSLRGEDRYMLSRTKKLVDPSYDSQGLLLLIPGQVLLIPVYLLFSRFNLVNSYLSVILIYTALALPFGIFFLTSSFRAIPSEVIESARIDGASLPRVFSSIILPLGRPAIATLAVLSSLSMWNELLLGMMLLPDESKRLITPTIALLLGRLLTNQPLLMAALLISSLPTVVMLAIASRNLISGITLGLGR